MDSTPNCKKCIHCHWDEQWKENICDKWKQAVYKGDEALACKFFEKRSGNDGRERKTTNA